MGNESSFLHCFAELQTKMAGHGFLGRKGKKNISIMSAQEAQSSLAIISDLVNGVKLSMSRPWAARMGRWWAGTNWLLRSVAIESSGAYGSALRARRRQKVGLTMASKVEEFRKITKLTRSMSGIGQLGLGITQLVEEGVDHGVDGRLSLCRGIFEQLGDEIDGVGISLAEDLAEGVRLDLGELVLHVVGVHGANLFPGGGAENFDNFDQLVNARLAGEEGLAEHELSHDTARRPDVWGRLAVGYGWGRSGV